MLRGSERGRRVLLAVSACAAALAAFPAGAGSAGRCSARANSSKSRPTTNATSRALRCMINAERRRRGLGRVRVSVLLSHAAQAHSDDMVARRYFDHATPEGVTAGRRVRLTGYLRRARAWGLGEAIGYATHDARVATRLATGFMASPEHRKLLLDPGFDELGVGVTKGWPVDGKRGAGLTVVLDLGRARRAR